MITTTQITSINADELKDWLDTALGTLLPPNTHISIIPQTWEAKGESRFFCEIDIDKALTLPQLLARVVSEHSRGNLVHFYAHDVVAAAVGAGELVGDHFYLYYRW